MNLYVTADAIGTPTGGGKVTFHESRALESMGPCEVWQFPEAPRPWGADLEARERLAARPGFVPQRAHFYSGTFSKTIEELVRRGTYVTYTAAAHDINVSREEHHRLGLPFDYPHLTDEHQWAAYVRGYTLADLVICPSTYSAQIMRGYGCQNVTVIPHGFDPVDRIAPMPARFVVGYLGQPGPDKGLSYLLDAWAAWEHGPGSILMIAGRGTQHLLPLVRQRLRGLYHVLGEVAEPRDLYDRCSVYVQPSASEGFGCEVLEARAHGRPVICSNGAGASAWSNIVVPACDVGALVRAIDRCHLTCVVDPARLQAMAKIETIQHLTWDRIRDLYVGVWS